MRKIGAKRLLWQVFTAQMTQRVPSVKHIQYVFRKEKDAHQSQCLIVLRCTSCISSKVIDTLTGLLITMSNSEL
jgi:hypothetical protein